MRQRGLFSGAAVIVIAANACPAAAQRLSLDLPAGPLGAVAETLARRAGISIALGDPVLWNRPVPRVRGVMTVETAIRALARHADADARRASQTVWRLTPRIKRAAVRPRSPARTRRGADPDIAGDEIIVLASKRRIPAQMMAASTAVIEVPRAHVEAGTAALVTRSTIISSTYRGAGREKLFIRGIADSSFSGRLQSVTGLYFGDVRLTYGASDPDLQLYDMASVEVLQGPQGALYGSGSMAGVIRLNPKPPMRAVAEGSMEVGVSAVVQGAVGLDTHAAVNLPLAPDVAVRAVGYARHDGGFIDKPALGEDVNRTRIAGGRVGVRWWPSDDWTVDAIAMTQMSRARDGQYATTDGPPLANSASVPEPFGSDYEAAHLVINGRLGALSLTSASGVARQVFREEFVAFTRDRVEVARRHRLMTHEMRLSRTGEDGTGWVAGGVVTHSRGASELSYRLPIYADQTLNHSLTEVALFGEGTVRLTPILFLGAGARAVQVRSATQLRFPAFPSLSTGRQSLRERWFLPTASILLRPAANLSAYLRYQEGRRAAAPPLGLEAAEQPELGERIASIDAGVRGGARGGVAWAVSVQRSRWRALQYDAFEGFVGLTSGAFSDWILDSAHAALTWPLARDLQVDAAVTVNRNRLEDPALRSAELQLPDVADVIARASVDWRRSVGRGAKAHVNAWARYEGGSTAAFGPFTPGRQGSYWRVGGTIEVERGNDALTLSVDNLLDRRETRYLLGSLVAAETIRTPLRPLTARIAYRHHF